MSENRYAASRSDYARWAASREPLHGIRWRWRYYIKWRLIGRKGPL